MLLPRTCPCLSNASHYSLTQCTAGYPKHIVLSASTLHSADALSPALTKPPALIEPLHSSYTYGPCCVDACVRDAYRYMGSYVSGAHFNPAVTLVHYLRGDVDATDAWSFTLAQTLGGLLGGLVAVFEGANFLPAVDSSASPLLILSAETLFSFALCLVHANVLSAKGPLAGRDGNDFFGITMGFVFLSGTQWALTQRAQQPRPHLSALLLRFFS